MLLITHHTGGKHGLLGPQIVATYLSKKFDIPVMVIGLRRGFDEEGFLKFVHEHCEKEEKIVLFSYHCGRPDILKLAETLRNIGFRTILGGPQADKDMLGEPNGEEYRERIIGFSKMFDLGYSGPVDMITKGILTEEIGLIRNRWVRDIEVSVNWDNLFIFDWELRKLDIGEAQVLRSIGCPYSMRRNKVSIDPPSFLPGVPPVEIEVGGCSFCDVAWDKGFCGHVSDEKVLEQIWNLPEIEGRKIPFELIDEYPIGFLPRLLEITLNSKVKLSQINLVLRADDILKKRKMLEESLAEIKKYGLKLFISSIGFESFSDKILKNLNKGISVAENLEAVKLIRELKRRFPETFFYTREEGAVHGFIHPTPWDDPYTEGELRSVIGAYDLFRDILPYHSTPLIIHHGCALADWVRQIEENYGVRFSRRVNIIEWWDYRRI